MKTKTVSPTCYHATIMDKNSDFFEWDIVLELGPPDDLVVGLDELVALMGGELGGQHLGAGLAPIRGGHHIGHDVVPPEALAWVKSQNPRARRCGGLYFLSWVG